ncbi:MAG TPA: hypothetical protein VGX50_15330 [Longimicrobium sp.]|nr:hypothetical protein [Longimicrobium sp.]
MSVGNIVRRLTGAAKNAVVWGATWTGLTFVIILGLRTVGVVVPPEIGVLDAIGMAVRVGILGGVTGGVFAGFISLFYRGQRLSQIDPVRFGAAGAVVAELFILAWFALGNMASGDGFPALRDIFSDLVLAAVFGFVAAGASMWLAQRVDALPAATEDALGRLGAGDPLAHVGTQDLRQHVPRR